MRKTKKCSRCRRRLGRPVRGAKRGLCPRCRKAVRLASRQLYRYRRLHKLCVKCGALSRVYSRCRLCREERKVYDERRVR